MSIKILAPDVAAKIAAGEVVERPANVAKELLENSLDAGSTDIQVEIRDGGQRLLRVTDNGHGIRKSEVAFAFERHATSKLQSAEDLNHIATFGFRGEALYSIAAVSQITMTTRHSEEEVGVQLRLEGGKVVSQTHAGAPVGTIISVENIFFNMPARKKFLRQPATEAGRISAVIQHYALAHPERRFSYVNNGKLIFQSNGSGKALDVMTKVYGLETARQMVAIGAPQGAQADPVELMGDLDAEVTFGSQPARERPQMTGDDMPVRVTGFVSLPTLTRANRTNINLFINRRYIEDRTLTYAVIQAYHTLLPGGRYPLATIFAEVATDEVDVNVHPQKTQVRFVHERKIFSAIQKAVRRTIIAHAQVPNVGLAASATDVRPLTAAHTPVAEESTLPPGWSARRDALLNAGRQQQPALDLPVTPPVAPPVGGGKAPAPRTATEDRSSDETAPAVTPPQGSHTPTQSTLDQRKHTLPPLRVVGQVGAMYIVTEGPEGMFLIDQHAAHERVLYEKFMDAKYGMAEGAVARQQLLEPLTLHTGSELAGLVAQHTDALRLVGFEIEPFGGDTFLVRAVPSVLSGQDPLRNLEEIVQAIADRRNLVGEELEARLVKMVCKRAAIKAGQQLSELEMQELIHQLEACQSPRTCPHGRPTMIQLNAGELEKAFGR